MKVWNTYKEEMEGTSKNRAHKKLPQYVVMLKDLSVTSLVVLGLASKILEKTRPLNEVWILGDEL